ncbi:MAG: hypothetical protein OXG52_01335 [bacterium]|nr:hypothetical protein [bacterium]
MKPKRIWRRLALLVGALVAVLATSCDYQTFRLAFGDVEYNLSGLIDERVRLDETGYTPDEEAMIDSTFITGAAGDLNGDGLLDGVTVLTTNTGGTGFFYTVHAILADGDGGFRDAGNVFIGDRVTVTGVELSGPRIEVSRLVRADDEPFVAKPTIPSPVHLILEDGELLVVTPTE